ncbi:MAG: hypothetical protein IH855_07020 [Bacteroidetes bacterium]|nr:hypothetical protein [Bacteroidota bacterium]
MAFIAGVDLGGGLDGFANYTVRYLTWYRSNANRIAPKGIDHDREVLVLLEVARAPPETQGDGFAQVRIRFWSNQDEAWLQLRILKYAYALVDKIEDVILGR